MTKLSLYRMIKKYQKYEVLSQSACSQKWSPNKVDIAGKLQQYHRVAVSSRIPLNAKSISTGSSFSDVKRTNINKQYSD